MLKGPGGRTPKPVKLRLLTGNAGHRPLPPPGPDPGGVPVRPPGLSGRAAELWAEVLSFATWLTRADGYKLAAWCKRQAQFEADDSAWSASDRREHRSSGGELGLDPASRQRLVGLEPARPPAKREGEEYFD